MVVFGAASGERGSLVPAELMKKNHSVVGFYLPNIMVRPELFGPSLERVLGWISSDDLKLTIAPVTPWRRLAKPTKPSKAARRAVRLS